MKQSDIDNAMVTLKALVVAHRVGAALSPLRVYLSARDSGVGWLRASDIAVTFARSADRLVEVGLALRMTEGKWRNREYRPSPIGLLVFTQHSDLFPKPPAGDAKVKAPPSSEASGERWRDLLAVLGILTSILSLIFASAGARSIGGWLLTGSIALFILYVTSIRSSSRDHE